MKTHNRIHASVRSLNSPAAYQTTHMHAEGSKFRQSKTPPASLHVSKLRQLTRRKKINICVRDKEVRLRKQRTTTEEKSRKRRKAGTDRVRGEVMSGRSRDGTEGLLTNHLHLHPTYRLCLDVIYPDYIYTWK